MGAEESPVACTVVTKCSSQGEVTFKHSLFVSGLSILNVKSSFQGVPQLSKVLVKNLREAISQDC